MSAISHDNVGIASANVRIARHSDYVHLRPGCFLREQVIGAITSGIARQ